MLKELKKNHFSSTFTVSAELLLSFTVHPTRWISPNLLRRFLSSLVIDCPETYGNVLIFENENHLFPFFTVFSVFVNMELYWDENVKTLFLVRITCELFPIFSWIFFTMVLTKVLFRVFKTSKNVKISNSPLCLQGYKTKSMIRITSNRKVKRGEIWGSRIVVTWIWVTFDL